MSHGDAETGSYTLGRFGVDSVFAIEARKLFVIVGRILEGKLRQGGILLLPLQHEEILERPIHSIEFIFGPPETRDVIALCVLYKDEDDLSILRNLKLADAEIKFESVM